jgi:glycosyltransferase involved in cell wall biosynthesis
VTPPNRFERPESRPTEEPEAEMRVLFAIAHFDKGGGQAVQALQLFQRLRDQVDGQLLCLSATGSMRTSDLPEGIEVVGPLEFPRGLLRLRRAIRDRMPSFDLLQAYDFYYALPAARLARAHPIVIRSGAHPVDDFGSRYGVPGRVAMRLANPWLYSGTTVVANARHLLGAFPHRRTYWIANGVDVQRFKAQPDPRGAKERLGLPPDSPIAAFTGKIVPRKNLEDLFWLLQHEPRLHLLLVGQTNEPYYGDQYYRSLLANFPDVRSRVHAPGEVPMSEIPPLLEAADVFVFPSRLEGMPNSLLEAMAAGLPVLAFDIEAHREVVPPEAGALYSNRADLLRATRRLLDEPEVRRALGQRARRFVEDRFSFEAATRSYLELYAKILGEQ